MSAYSEHFLAYFRTYSDLSLQHVKEGIIRMAILLSCHMDGPIGPLLIRTFPSSLFENRKSCSDQVLRLTTYEN